MASGMPAARRRSDIDHGGIRLDQLRRRRAVEDMPLPQPVDLPGPVEAAVDGARSGQQVRVPPGERQTFPEDARSAAGGGPGAAACFT